MKVQFHWEYRLETDTVRGYVSASPPYVGIEIKPEQDTPELRALLEEKMRWALEKALETDGPEPPAED